MLPFTFILLLLCVSLDAEPGFVKFFKGMLKDIFLTNDLVVPTNDGPVLGMFIPSFDAVFSRVFRGIPYADQPQRFQPAKKFSRPWGGIDPKTGEFFGLPKPCIIPETVCPQFGLELKSEDCLFLNVYTPSIGRIAKAKKSHSPKGLPVMFWIFGGAFYMGSGSTYTMYDGSYLVNHNDVIVVTHNYRVGAFGFLASKNSDGTEYSGNVGIQDQLLALDWGDSFGGDPNRITIIGQSAGALSTAIHLASDPGNKGWISGAIMESPPLGLYMRSHDEALSVGHSFAKNLSCLTNDMVDAACLAKKSSFDIVLAQRYLQPSKEESFRPLSDFFWWWPHVDGNIIKENPLDTLTKHPSHVPVIIGTTKHETGLFSLLYDVPILTKIMGLRQDFKKDGFEKYVRGVFKEEAIIKQVLQQYPPGKNEDEDEVAFINLTTDYMFSCPTLKVAKSLSQYSDNIFLYEVAHIPGYIPFAMNCFRKQVCHATDLPYLWRPLIVPLRSSDVFVSELKQSLWMAFMSTTTFTSNMLQGKTRWFALNATNNDEFYNLHEEEVGMRANFRNNLCDLWVIFSSFCHE